MAEENRNPPIDSKVEISVASNQLEAYVTVTEPRFGGKDVTLDDIMAEIGKNRINTGIDQDVLSSIAAEKKYDELICFAKGTPAVNGTDGTISYHFDKEVNIAPVENELGFVDYKDLGLIRNVTFGTVIADITEPTPGENGVDVRGNVLRCIPGKKARYTIGANTALSEDGSQIVSKAEGNINFKGGAFVVDNIVKINGDVDAGVGNIDFIGDVEVKGEVTAGFKIISKSNIVVHGNVNGAQLEAEGNILIKKGCINSQLKANGDVSINFCEYSKIHCEGNLSSVNFVVCDVYCGGTLSTKGNSGGLKGGKYTCMNSIEAYDVGTKNYTKTEINVGGNAVLTKEKTELTAQIEAAERKIKDLGLIINFLTDKQKQGTKLAEDKEKVLGDSARQKILLSVEISKAQKRIAEINEALTKRQFLSLSCRGTLFPGVKVVINDEAEKIEDEYRKCKVYLGEEGNITVGIY